LVRRKKACIKPVPESAKRETWEGREAAIHQKTRPPSVTTSRPREQNSSTGKKGSIKKGFAKKKK